MRHSLLMLALLIATAGASLAQTTCPGLAVCFTSVDKTTRVTIEVSPDVHFAAKHLSNPERVFFDIEGANIDSGKSQTIRVADGLVKQIRTAGRPPSVTRVVFDLEQPADFTTSELHNPDRLQIVLRPTGTPISTPSARAANPVMQLAAKPAAAQPTRIGPPATPAAAKAATNGDVRFWSQDDLTRVSIELPPDTQFTAKRLSEPERVFFDIQAPKINAKRSRTIPVGDPRVKQIRVASSQPDVTRVVLDLEQFAEFTTARAANPDRLIIEVRPKTERPKNHPPPFPTTSAPPPRPTPVATAMATETPRIAAPVAKVVPPTPNVTSNEPVSPVVEPQSSEPAPPIQPQPEAPLAKPAPALAAVLPAPPVPAVVPAEVALEKKIHISSASRVLKIVPLQGEGGINNIKTATSIDPVVEVRDDHDMPLPGAEVTFQFPVGGASGFFPGRSLTLTTRTNEQGQAQAAGAIPNDVAGRFNIKVAANSEDRIGSTIISQVNVNDMADAARVSKQRSRKWIILGIVASAAITAGIIVATHSGGSSTAASAPSSISITPGSITIGGPH